MDKARVYVGTHTALYSVIKVAHSVQSSIVDTRFTPQLWARVSLSDSVGPMGSEFRLWTNLGAEPGGLGLRNIDHSGF